MRDRSFDPKSLLRILPGALFVVTLALGSQALAADDEDDDPPFEEKIMRALLGQDKESIDYRERSPLVVPPTSTLPPPEAGKAIADPAWPKDADVQRVKKARKRDQIQRNRDIQRDGQPLTPDQLAGRAPPGSGGVGAPSSRENEERVSGRALSPSELGTRGNIFSKIFSTGDSTETAVFPGEPARQSLTDPPVGYMTPSPNYPYGLLPSKVAPKAATIEERAVGRKD